MASINIYTVKKLAEERGWTVVTDTYKNLDTEMDFLCPRGHQVFGTTFRKWRDRPICIECERDNTYKFSDKIPPKGSTKRRIFALDAATQQSGWSLFDDGKLVGYGIIIFSQSDVTARINSFKKWLQQAIFEWNPDIVVFEDIQLQMYGEKENLAQVKTYNRLARAQGVNLDVVFENKLEEMLINSSEWRKGCNISGKKRAEQKQNARIKVKTWYGIDVGEDEADSICLGRYAAKKAAKEEEVSWE